MQVITKLRCWFEKDLPENMRPYLRPYTIMSVGAEAGIIECLTDSRSVDEIKKLSRMTSLSDFFERAYGGGHRHEPPDLSSPLPPPAVVSLEEAQDNFLRSLVGYSLVCYILQIKDRHNANILMDRSGHVVHIDFGYVMGETPKMSKVPIFSESAPFKLTAEYLGVVGFPGPRFVRFMQMFEAAFGCASDHADEIASVIEVALTMVSNPAEAAAAAREVRERLRPRVGRERRLFVRGLVDGAIHSWGTSTYDWLQRNMNGYAQ